MIRTLKVSALLSVVLLAACSSEGDGTSTDTLLAVSDAQLLNRTTSRLCEATGNGFAEAVANYNSRCSLPRVDCDPEGRAGMWRCASAQLGNAAPGRVSIASRPSTTVATTTTSRPAPAIPALPDNVCAAVGGNLDLAKREYAAHCSEPRVDCDPLAGGDWICASAALGRFAPTSVAQLRPVAPRPPRPPRPEPPMPEPPMPEPPMPEPPMPEPPMPEPPVADACPCELLLNSLDSAAFLEPGILIQADANNFDFFRPTFTNFPGLQVQYSNGSDLVCTVNGSAATDEGGAAVPTQTEMFTGVTSGSATLCVNAVNNVPGPDLQ